MTMLISSKDRRFQAGLSLFEMLLVLAIIAFVTASLSGNFLKISPQFVVNNTANHLVIDLKRARLEMLTTDTPISVSFSSDGYSIAALEITRAWPNAVSAEINGQRQYEIVFAPDAQLHGYDVSISKGGSNVTIGVAPITRRISRR